MRPVLRLAVRSAILRACHRPAPRAAFEGEIEIELEVDGIYTFLVSVKGDKRVTSGGKDWLPEFASGAMGLTGGREDLGHVTLAIAGNGKHGAGGGFGSAELR